MAYRMSQHLNRWRNHRF